MEKQIEDLMKEREAIHPKCRGEGFTETEKEFLRRDKCPRIELSDVEDADPNCEDTPCFCSAYAKPSIWWNHSSKRCPLGEHYRPDLKTHKSKVRVGQQKQKKR